MTAVPVQTAPTFSFGNPTKLFSGPYFSNGNGRNYDVSPDGKRFPMIKEGGGANGPNASPASMVVVIRLTRGTEGKVARGVEAAKPWPRTLARSVLVVS